jgi:hypothetical protein
MFNTLWNALYGSVRASLARALLASVNATGRAAERLCARLELMQHYSYPQYLVACVIAAMIYVVATLVEWCSDTMRFVGEAFISKEDWRNTYGR